MRLPSRLDISRHSRTLITPVGLPLAAWASKKLWAEMIRKRFHRIEQRPPNLNTPLAMTLNIDNPFVILGVCVFAVSAVASVFGPARWNTGMPKFKFALIGGLLLLAGVAIFLFAQS